MISTRRGIIIGLVIGSLVGGTAGATILEASGHGQSLAQAHVPAAPVHGTADYESSSTT